MYFDVIQNIGMCFFKNVICFDNKSYHDFQRYFYYTSPESPENKTQ